VASSNHLKSCQDEQSYSGIQASDVRVDDGLKPCQPQDKVQTLKKKRILMFCMIGKYLVRDIEVGALHYFKVY
jgi:hypothetical protein